MYVALSGHHSRIVMLTAIPVFTLKPEAMPEWKTSTGSGREAVQFQDSTEESFLKAAFDTSAIKTTM